MGRDERSRRSEAIQSGSRRALRVKKSAPTHEEPERLFTFLPCGGPLRETLVAVSRLDPERVELPAHGAVTDDVAPAVNLF
jgi:hypothetical protein